MYFADGNSVFKYNDDIKKIVLIKDRFKSHWEAVEYILSLNEDAKGIE